MMLALTIVHVVISVVLVIAVLMQHGKQQGLSGAIAGGAETFFGKNKGKTIDAILRKVTAVVAILFVISSLTLAAVAINQYNNENAVNLEETTQLPVDVEETPVEEEATTPEETEGEAETEEPVAEEETAEVPAE